MTEIYKPWERNETNQNSFGGTELHMEKLLANLDPELLQHFQLIPSRVRDLRDDKIRVLNLHDLPLDPEAEHLKDPWSRSRFHKIVYCGNWQMNQYEMRLGIPHDQKLAVLESAIEPIPYVEKNKDEVRLIYTSTPQRGLSILVPVFEALAQKHDNIVLDVFSSYKIYGWESADAQFEELYERCRQHPRINYHGFASNDTVREALQRAHIFSYPSIWLECNCKALIEAMSAGLLCVHPNYGGLIDTSGGMTAMYNWDKDINKHANIFYAHLDNAINIVNQDNVQNYLQFQKQYADARFNWTKVLSQWDSLLRSLYQEYKDTDLSLPGQYLTFRTT
jgi:UDP-glucose:(glucosyl)LPS alpha-1,2-glucosyltransferase